MQTFTKLLLLGLLVVMYEGRAQNPTPVPMQSLAPKNLLQKGVSLTGMLAGNHVYYAADGIPNRTVPFNVLYTGNLSVDILGKIKMPVSFSFSNQTVQFAHPFDRAYQFRQPFNRLLLKPTYKGFTLQVGTCAMQFSPYTVAGHRYDGIGLEYKNPKKSFYGSLMVGNLQRAVRLDTSYQTFNNRPSYKRSGIGLMAGYKKNEDRAELIFFTAADRLTSLPYTLDEFNILPQQNAVVALKGSKLVVKKLLVSAEIAFSGITNDLRAPETTRSTNLIQTFFGTFSPKTSTDFRKAFKTELLYRGKKFNTGLQYSRVDPNYRTLGAYFFVNDLETIEGKIATQLWDGKLSVGANLGIQHDNVDRQKLKTNQRTVGMLNLQLTPNQQWNVMLNYSNFSNYSNIIPAYAYLTRVTPYNALDTLNFRQINQNLMAMVTFNFPTTSQELLQSIVFNGVFQKGDDQLGNASTQNNLSNVSLDYSLNHTTQKLMVTTSFNFTQSHFNNLPNTQWGPALSLHKGLGKKWRTNLSSLYTWGKTPATDALASRERTINARWGLTGQVSSQFNLMLNLIYLDRKVNSVARAAPSFREFTATLGFSYQFNAKLWAPKK